MKNAIKVFGIIAFVAVIGFSIAACGDDDGGGNKDKTFTSDMDFKMWILQQPNNTPTTAYVVNLKLSSLNSFSAPNLSNFSIENFGKYIILDFSGSTFTDIGENVFYSSNAILGITNLPNTVTSIGNGAFADCTGLTSITIPNSVTRILGSSYSGAFRGCTGLTSITIPDKVTAIGENAFNACTNLTSVTLQSGMLISDFNSSAFLGDLHSKYYPIPTGGPGTYTTTAPVSSTSIWTKQ